MPRLPHLLGLVLLGLACLVGTGTTQEKKDDKKTEKKDTKKVVNLPPFFKGLELTDDQKKKIADLQNDYKPKIGDLAKQIGELNKKMNELKKGEQQDIFKVLTDTQKKKYDDDVAASKKKKEPEKKKVDGK